MDAYRFLSRWGLSLLFLGLFLNGCATMPKKATPPTVVINPETGVVSGTEDFFLKKIQQIVIDPGHGGKDPGAIGVKGLQEKGVVLDIAKRLKKILEHDGVQVKMTRETDEFISLPERTQFASRTKADLFISIHANSSPARSICGMEVFSLSDLGSWERNEVQRKENQRILFNRLAMKAMPAQVQDIVEDMLYCHKQTESDILALKVIDKTTKLAKTKNRGLKYSRFFVLRNTLVPAVLVEVGFLTNPKEEALLNTGAYRQKIADGLAASLLDYIHE